MTDATRDTAEDFAVLTLEECHALNYWRWKRSGRGQQDIRRIEWPGYATVPTAPLRWEFARWLVEEGILSELSDGAEGTHE